MLDLHTWLEALASCAIEGNPWAEETLALQQTDPEEFTRRIALLEEDYA